MSASCVSFRSECDDDYSIDSRGSFERIHKQNRRPQYRRSSVAPGSTNGIHRRRNSRWTWGHGSRATMQNLRSFARCALAAVVAFWASTSTAGVLSSMDFVPIGNPGNVGNVISSGTFGSVASQFNMGKTEVSYSQYAAFLNAAAKTDTYGLYSTRMSGSNGGLTRAGSDGSFTYAVKDATWGSRPVGFVTLYDAARYVNWLHNGEPANPTDSQINNGAYTLNSSVNPGVALVRNIGATVFLPTRNEWYKAAFYGPSLNGGSGGYYTYATGTNSPPSVSTNPAATGSNLALFNQSTGANLLPVDALPNSKSAYGALNMAGNSSEWLQDSTATQGYWIGGWVQMSTANQNTFGSSAYSGGLQSSMAELSYAQGFRIAAVPEPSTIVTALGGFVTLAGGAMIRRKSKTRRQS